MSQLRLQWLTECRKNKIKQLLYMIWEEEHLIFRSLKLVRVLYKLKPLTEILRVVEKILTGSFRNSYWMSSRSNQELMFRRTNQLFRD